jgi:anthranilate phosphoribosyltransferase
MLDPVTTSNRFSDAPGPDERARPLLDRMLSGDRLREREAGELLTLLCDDRIPQAMAGAVLAALRTRGETPAEVRGMAAAMRRLALRPDISPTLGAVDVVGTGGDGSGSLNLSTGSALLAAACGQPVVKHGNRAVSSKSCSADVLAALGHRLPLDGDAAREDLERCGFTFLFAPTFHPAMKALAPIRRTLGVRTTFNILGPLTNPAEPPYAVIGAFDEKTAGLLAEALAGMPVRRTFVVHGTNGWDEATPVAPYRLLEVTRGRVRYETRDPRDVGLPRCSPEDLRGGDSLTNAAALRAAFAGERGAHRDALVLGAALALEVSGATPDLAGGVARAGAAIDAGHATAFLERLGS